MTLSEYAQAVADVCGKSDSASLAKIKGFVRRRYRMVFDAHLWRDALCIASKTAGDDELIAPASIEKIVAMRWDSLTMYPVDQQTLFQYDPEIFERSGTPLQFSHLTPTGLHTLPAVSEKLRFVSDDAADLGEMLVRGEIGGEEFYEVVTLNGTTPVDSANTLAAGSPVFACAKAATTGNVTIKGATSATVFQTLWPTETEKKHARIRLHEQPQDLTKSLLILGKRRCRDLTHDLDTPILRGLDNVLIAYGCADELTRQRQYAKAAAKAQEAAAQITIALSGEKDQQATQSRFIPWVESYEYEGGDDAWLS